MAKVNRNNPNFGYGLNNALQSLAPLPIIADRDPTTNDIAELGSQADALHTELGTSIANTKVELLLAAGRFARIVAESAKASAKHNIQVKCFDDTISACDNLHEFIRDYDIILVKGSRTARLELAIEKLKELF